MKIWYHGPWLRVHANIYQRLPFMATKQDSVVVTAEAQESSGVSVAASFPSPTTIHEGPNIAGEEFESRNSDQKAVKHDTTLAAVHPLPWEITQDRRSNLDHDNSQPQDLKAYMEEMLDWNRPNKQGHWPPYEDYINRSYDPNRWEEFDL